MTLLESAEVEIVPPSAPPDAAVVLPGSKSLTNRALLIAALADGRSVLRQALFSDDTHYMASALRALGLAVGEDEAAATFVVEGASGAAPATQGELFVGNAGTAMRFLIAYLTLGRGRFLVDGVARMRQRPIGPLLDGLCQLGAHTYSKLGTGCPPVVVEADGLLGGRATMAGDQSSQYFSALLLVGGYSRAGIEVIVQGELVSKPYVDLTLGVMASFGVEGSHADYRILRVAGGQRYRGREYVVEPDASGASYYFAAAAATGGRVRVEHLGRHSTQGDLAFVDLLERMGCRVLRGDDFTEVQGPSRLAGLEADLGAISDTAPTLGAIAPLAESPVTIRGIGHVRLKETDRIAALATELRRLGVRVDEFADGLTIYPARPRPTAVATYDDHRMAMSFAVLGLAVPGIRIQNPACVAKTFPDFFDRLQWLGAGIRGVGVADQGSDNGGRD